MGATAKTTTNHDEIRQWVEERGGQPARVKGTDDSGSGILRIDYPGYSGEETLETISWDEFFKGFEQNDFGFSLSGGNEGRQREPLFEIN